MLVKLVIAHRDQSPRDIARRIGRSEAWDELLENRLDR